MTASGQVQTIGTAILKVRYLAPWHDTDWVVYAKPTATAPLLDSTEELGGRIVLNHYHLREVFNPEDMACNA